MYCLAYSKKLSGLQRSRKRWPITTRKSDTINRFSKDTDIRISTQGCWYSDYKHTPYLQGDKGKHKHSERHGRYKKAPNQIFRDQEYSILSKKYTRWE